MSSVPFCSSGFIDADENESTVFVRQEDILKDASRLTAAKSFSLDLNEFGPYILKYNPNGRRLLLGGARGHLASFDWLTKKLIFEVQVHDRIRDLAWLHDETILAVAQKKYAFVYDINGVELHRIKNIYQPEYLEFLPHHFLLVSASKNGYLSYFDTSTGTLVSSSKTLLGRPNDMCQNVQSGVISLAHQKGTVSFWCPKQEKAAISILCSASFISSIAIDFSGLYLATADLTRYVKIWDLRTLKPLSEIRLYNPGSSLKFSQTGLLAINLGHEIEIYSDMKKNPKIYLRQNIPGSHISGIDFCHFEDILGISHNHGFMSMIVPGAGEAKIDSLNPNPFQTINQRKEYGVKKLLEKIQPDMITIDPSVLSKVTQPNKTQDEIAEEFIFKRLIPKKPHSKKAKPRVYKQIQDQTNREKRRLKLMEKIKNSQKEEM